MTVRIAKKVVNKIHASMIEEKREVCFLLDGEKLDNIISVTNAVYLLNTARSSFFFIIREKDYTSALGNLKKSLVGFFHSHLRTNEPSEADIHSMRKHKIPWLIAHLDNDILKFSAYIHDHRALKTIKTIVL